MAPQGTWGSGQHPGMGKRVTPTTSRALERVCEFIPHEWDNFVRDRGDRAPVEVRGCLYFYYYRATVNVPLAHTDACDVHILKPNLHKQFLERFNQILAITDCDR